MIETVPKKKKNNRRARKNDETVDETLAIALNIYIKTNGLSARGYRRVET